MTRRVRAWAIATAATLVLAGCQTVVDPGIYEPTVTPVTAQSYNLRTLPAPAKRIPVAVYDFPDLTGQYKERDNVQTLSRAVTQGGAPMLIKALQDAGERRWFSVLDRARLDDILKERQIVTEMRRIYRDEQKIPASVLPPLAHAGIIMQGGITGYDTNVQTGGVGVRYLGLGPHGRWQLDSVTVTLRAVSTNTGEVLASVTVHKDIASTALQGGNFSFIELDKILEVEAGVSKNEPKQIAVQQAIEKAVVALVVEGTELGIWSFADRAAGQAAIDAYRGEKYGDRITAAAYSVPPPATRNPADVVVTAPVEPRASTPRRPRPPAAAESGTPPPPAENEVVGSIPAQERTPPPAAPGEVVG
jgi:curli production assembly/transport component CsgG